MTPGRFFRAIAVLLLVPPLTLAISIGSIISLTILRRSASRVQALPRWWGRTICAAGGVTVRVEGAAQLEAGRPYIFAANHQSQFDIFALQGYLQTDFRWLAKKELFRIPIWGAAMRLSGSIPIDRSHGRQALKSLGEAADRIAAGTSVVIFPEGTRSRDGRIQTFKAGAMILAIKSGVPLVPVAIKGTYEILPKGGFLVKPGPVLIRLGKPINTGDYRLKQKHELARRLQEEVSGLFEDRQA